MLVSDEASADASSAEVTAVPCRSALSGVAAIVNTVALTAGREQPSATSVVGRKT